jgi:hypothetical protein
MFEAGVQKHLDASFPLLHEASYLTFRMLKIIPEIGRERHRTTFLRLFDEERMLIGEEGARGWKSSSPSTASLEATHVEGKLAATPSRCRGECDEESNLFCS